MIDLTDIREVQALQGSLRTIFENDNGVEVMSFLESLCGWYDFKETDKDKILIGHGKRQVLATIKSLMVLSAQQVVALAQTEGVNYV